MWSISERVALSPAYGPHRALDEETLRAGLAGLLEAVRELCLRDKHRDVPSISIRHQRRPDELEQIADRFYLKGREAVCDFLRRHRLLVPVLVEARKKFDEHFAERLRPRLEVFVDPEDNHSARKLFALVLTTLSSSEAAARLESLDEDWWLDQPAEVKRLMNIDVEYVNASV